MKKRKPPPHKNSFTAYLKNKIAKKMWIDKNAYKKSTSYKRAIRAMKSFKKENPPI